MATTGQISCINLNARSIVSKMDALESLLLHLEPHFAAKTETLLTSDLRSDAVLPPNYAIIKHRTHQLNCREGLAFLALKIESDLLDQKFMH